MAPWGGHLNQVLLYLTWHNTAVSKLSCPFPHDGRSHLVNPATGAAPNGGGEGINLTTTDTSAEKSGWVDSGVEGFIGICGGGPHAAYVAMMRHTWMYLLCAMDLDEKVLAPVGTSLS